MRAKVEIIREEKKMSNKEKQLFGKINEYSVEEPIKSWFARFDNFLKFNDVKDEKKMMWLVGYGGGVIFEKLNILCAPKIPEECDYDQKKQELIAIIQPKVDHGVARKNFFCRVQNNGESISDFAMALKEIANDCNFGTSYLEPALRDRFIFNLSNEKIKCELIKLKMDSKFEEAVSEAQLRERNTTEDHEIARVSAKSRLGPQKRQRSRYYSQQFCRTCGREGGHDRGFVCPAIRKRLTCNFCKKQGHKEIVCMQRLKQEESGNRHHRRAAEVTSEDENSSMNSSNENLGSLRFGVFSEYNTNLSFITPKTEPPLIHKFRVDGVPILCEIDSGACISILTRGHLQDYFKNSLKIYAMNREKKFYTADGKLCEIFGVVSVKVNDMQDELQAVVLNTYKKPYPLIGRNWLDVLVPDWRDFFENELKKTSTTAFVNSTTAKQTSTTSYADTKTSLCTENASVCVHTCANECEILKKEMSNAVTEKKNNLQFVENSSKEVDEKVKNMRKIIVKDYENLFKPKNTPIKNFLVDIELKPDATPKFMKAAVPPYALREKIEKKFDEWTACGIAKKVDYCDWGTQIVIAPKKLDDIRICGNYKITVNPQIQENHHPIPYIEDLINEMSGCKFFSSIDLSGAFLQLQLSEKSIPITTVNTHMGLFSFNRLPFGIKSAPGIFQSVTDKLLQGKKRAVGFFDDILCGGENLEECMKNTRAVLDVLMEHNVTANFEKSLFFVEKLVYLGFEISSHGIRPSSEKVKAIIGASPPKDLTSVRSFLGLINFYGKFIPNLQSRLSPIHKLLQKNVKFEWTSECQKVFEDIKKIIVESPLLVHFDPSKEIVLTCDASPYGVGGILSNVVNGVERPVQMYSSSLSPAEKNYSQLHREALAIVSSVKKFHKYVFGRKVIVYTDCKALESLLSHKRNLDNVVNSRFIRWVLFLQNYNLIVKFRESKKNADADALSRLPLLNETTEIEEESLSFFSYLNTFNDDVSEALSHEKIAIETDKSPLGREIISYIKNGWVMNEKISEYMKPFYDARISLDTQSECIFFGDRVYIPPKLRKTVLKHLHREHNGIVKMKKLVRGSVWWPKIDQDIKMYIKGCETCQMNGDTRKQCELASWKKTCKPMERVHLDHFFFKSKSYLVIVDDYSNYVHVDSQSKVDTRNVIMSMKKFFAIFGLCEKLVTDNGTAFTSDLFEKFCEANQIEHIKSPPYHPQSNGLAERYVGIVKSNLKKFLCDQRGSIEEQIQNFLFNYHTTPLADGSGSPSEKLFKYKIVTNLNRLQKPTTTSNYSTAMYPKPQSHPHQNQEREKNRREKKKKLVQREKNVNEKKNNKIEDFVLGELVWVKEINAPTNFIKATVVQKLSQFVYRVKLQNGHCLLKHRDSMKKYHKPYTTTDFPQAKKVQRQPSYSEVLQENLRKTPREIPRVDYRIYF